MAAAAFVRLNLPVVSVVARKRGMLFELSGTATLWIKALHIIGVIAWMAGMLYLPRLFVYHCEAEPGSAQSDTFKLMERRLLRGIMNPAMIASLVLGGILLAASEPGIWRDGWLHLKLLAVFGLLAAHGLFSRWRRQFAADVNRRDAKFYRAVNEVPTVLMVIIVIMAVTKPF